MASKQSRENFKTGRIIRFVVVVAVAVVVAVVVVASGGGRSYT